MYILPDLIISVKHLLMCEHSVIMNCLYDYTFTYLTLIKRLQVKMKVVSFKFKHVLDELNSLVGHMNTLFYSVIHYKKSYLNSLLAASATFKQLHALNKLFSSKF